MKIKYILLCSEGNIDRINNVEIIKKQIPKLNVIMSNRQNVFNNFVEMFNLEEEYDGVVVLEDDIQLCNDFKNKLLETIKGHEHEVVSMFESACSKKELKSEYRKGNRFAWNQCNYYPKSIANLIYDKSLVEEFIVDYNSKNNVWNYPSDTYIAYALHKYKISYYMSVPFLVQHLPFKSNFQGRPLNRQSKYFIDDIEKEVE